jgi:hypothetical protein
VRGREDRLLFGAEHDLPAEGILDQPRSGDPPRRAAPGDTGQVPGPPEPHPADLGQIDRAPPPVDPPYLQIARLRDVHGHPGPQPGLEHRAFGGMVGIEEVRPRLPVGLQHRLRRLRGQVSHPVDLMTGHPDRRVTLLQRRQPALPKSDELMQQIPQRASGVRLTVQHRHLSRAQLQPRHLRPLHRLHTVIVSVGLPRRGGKQNTD